MLFQPYLPTPTSFVYAQDRPSLAGYVFRVNKHTHSVIASDPLGAKQSSQGGCLQKMLGVAMTPLF